MEADAHVIVYLTGKSATNVSQLFDMTNKSALKEKLEMITFKAFRELGKATVTVYLPNLSGQP